MRAPSSRRGATLKGTGLGAASSSCSYAAIAIAKSVFQKGAGLPAAVAFTFASTNLVSDPEEDAAREHAREAQTGHQHTVAGADRTPRHGGPPSGKLRRARRGLRRIFL